MKNYCKGICKNYKAVKENNSFSYYSNGFKRCNECEIFIDWNSYKCPCCHNILRIKPHNTTCKTRILKEYVYIWVNIDILHNLIVIKIILIIIVNVKNLNEFNYYTNIDNDK